LPCQSKWTTLARGMSTPRRPWSAPGSLSTIFLCIALLVSVSIGHSEVRGVQQVRVLVPQTTAALPFLRIEKEGPGSGVGIDVHLFSNHAQALALLLRGDADLLLSGTSQGWENRLDGSSIVMIDTGVWGLASLVGKDASIRAFSDLRGRRVALPFPGSPLDFQTRAILAHESLDPQRDLTISYGPFTQSVARLIAGQIDTAALPEPVATAAVRKSGLLRLIDYAAAWAAVTGGDGRSPQVSLFTTQSFASAHRQVLADLVAAWRESSSAISRGPSDAARSFASALGLDASILEEATRRTILEVPTPAENRARVMDYYRRVAPFLAPGRQPLDEGFFFLP